MEKKNQVTKRITTIMENFFIDGEFYRSIEDYLIDCDLEIDDIKSLADTHVIIAEQSILEKMFVLRPGDLCEILSSQYEERGTENGDEWDSIDKAINSNVDFEKINAAIPEMYYPSKKYFNITKADLLAAFE